MQQGAFSRAAQSIISRVAAAAGKTGVRSSGGKSAQIRRPSPNRVVNSGASVRSKGMPSFTEYKNAGKDDTVFSPIPTLEELYNRVKGGADSSREKTWDNSSEQSGENSSIADNHFQTKKEDGPSEKTTEDTSSKDVNWGTLAYGMLEQGANDFVSSFTGTLDMLAGDFAQEIWTLGGLMFGISDAGTNPITAANNYMQETTRKEAEYYAQNASGSKTAENLNKYGTVVASALPTLAMAMMTGGMSNAGMAKEGIEKAAFMAKSTDFSRYVDMARSVIKQTAKNPNAQMAFIQGAGYSYEMALEEGATETEAALFSILNGGFNSITAVGGGNKDLGGIQSLPQNVKTALQGGDSPVVMEYAKSVVQEVGEGQLQRWFEKTMRSIYDPNVKLGSLSDENAIFNPKDMWETAKADFVSASAAGGVHASAKAAEKGLMTAAGKSFSRIDSFRFARELAAASPEYSFADAMEQGYLLHKATTGNMLTASEFDRLSMTNQTIQQMFTERTNIPFSVYDNADASVLRRKYSSGIIKVANNDVRAGNSQFGLIDLFRASGYNGKNSKLPHKHAGGWDNSVIISDGTQLNKGILKPNCSYVAGENNYIYKTDELGRQCGATACLQLKKHDKRKGNVGKPADKLPGDEAGHLFADMFGGSRFLDNLVAQSFDVNRSKYRKMENVWQRALKDGKSVYADIDLNYEGNSFRPTSFDITYYIDGEYTMLRIYNE